MPLFPTPLLWAIGGVAVLVAGALGAFVTADTLADRVLHDTYFVAAHVHYVLQLAVAFGFFAGWYALFPRVTGYAYSHRLGNIHFWLSLAGDIAMLAPQVLIAMAVDASDLLHRLNLMATVGASVWAAGFVVFLANMALSLRRRRPAG